MSERVVITGLGFISSIGHDANTVADSLKHCRSGIGIFNGFPPNCPLHLAGLIRDFSFPSTDVEDWTFPDFCKIPVQRLRSMSPNVVYGYASVEQAVASAGLAPGALADDDTALFAASSGSTWLMLEGLDIIRRSGPAKCPPSSLPSSIAGTLNFNLSTAFGIRGSSVGFTSACSSSAHALGHAYDQICLGRHKRIVVCGAEDVTWQNILPFLPLRALSTSSDPVGASCPFDRKRSGMVVTGGAATLILEPLSVALERGAPIVAELLGWGESADGHHVVSPEPNGKGLERAIRRALAASFLAPVDVDYINAHATSTLAGDVAECNALTRVFTGDRQPWVSSTKSLTGHGLSLAGALEAGITALALQKGFFPVSANVTEIDPACAGVRILTKPTDGAPRTALSNSSGFGGSNVCLAFRRWEAAA